jgi:hypothetical protein
LLKDSTLSESQKTALYEEQAALVETIVELKEKELETIAS